MPPRPSWKGYLKLSLVSCPVALYPSSSTSERISFHMLNAETHNRLKQQYIDAETGDIVERDDRVKGYEVAKGDYVIVSDDEIADVKIESSHTIDIEKFVPKTEIDPLYFDSSYYLTPDDKVGEEAFACIREAMRKREMVGIARVVLYGRERMLMVEPRAKGLVGTTLRYAYEVRAEGAYFDEIPKVELSKELLDLASHIIDTKAGAFEPDAFQDRYQDALVELIRAKQAGRPAPSETPSERPSNVVNLMDALRRSLGQTANGETDNGGAKSKTTPAKAPAKKAPAKQAPAKQEPAKQGPAKQGPAKQGPAKQGPAKQGPAKQGKAGRPKSAAKSVPAAAKRSAARKAG